MKRSWEDDDDGGSQHSPPSLPDGSQVYDSVFDDPIARSQLSAARYYVTKAIPKLGGLEPLDRVS